MSTAARVAALIAAGALLAQSGDLRVVMVFTAGYVLGGLANGKA